MGLAILISCVILRPSLTLYSSLVCNYLYGPGSLELMMAFWKHVLKLPSGLAPVLAFPDLYLPVLVLSPYSIATAANIISHMFQAQTLLPFTLSITEQSCPFLLHEYFLLLTLTVSQVPSIPSVWLSSWVISINCSSTECLGARVLQASFLDLLFFSGNTVTPRDDGFILRFHMSHAYWKLSDVHIFMTSLWISNSHSQLPTEKLFADLNKHGTGKKKFIISLPLVLIHQPSAAFSEKAKSGYTSLSLIFLYSVCYQSRQSTVKSSPETTRFPP